MKTNPKQFVFSPFANQPHHQKGIDYNKSESKKNFSQKDIDTAEDNGYKRGHAEGLNTGIEQGKGELFQAEQQLNATLSAIVPQLSQVTENLDKTIERKHKETIKLATAIAKKVSGDILNELQTKKIEGFIAQTLPKLFKEKHLLLIINPDLENIAQIKTSEILKEHGIAEKIKIVADDQVPVNSCKIEWDNGGVEYNTESIWQEINKALGINLDGNPAPPVAQSPMPAQNNTSNPTPDIEKKPEDNTTKT
jgi:flagellar assembly protein FliH